VTEHQHRFRLTMHLDGCHFYRSSFACECGATAVTYDERDPAEDPYSAVWMEPTSEEPCNRCVELLGGAKPEHHSEVFEAAT
jgi:hypothetical protein